VSQGWAGGQFGTMAIPRIGHEVIVTFLEGDPDRPLITGRVFNSASPVPYPLPEHKTRTVFKSMTTPGIEGEMRGFNELRIEDKKGQEEIYVHAEKDVNVYVKNDWKEHVLNDQHRTIDNFSYSLVKGEDQQTVHLDRKVELLSDDHLTVRGSRHCRIGKKWLVAAGKESHVAAGRKIVVEAGSELTIKAGGSFIKIDPSGVYVGGAKVRINSGGSPGMGSGASPLLPHNSGSVDEGTAPITQIDALGGAAPKQFCEECNEGDFADMKEQYDEMVELIDQNGRPIPNYPYYAETVSGAVYSGRTDEMGCTCRVHTDNSQNIKFFFGDEALQKLKGEVHAK
jgi:type VI secretion system secreted protein VgrG